ncbi:diguanylate cyclase [Natranaerofaba carboxydovora]|uniref:sensor domain-containing diguanylate cyclase n=1 Tax=Natranaerofaba carboxydovora TaxID=2742683 RepID=UPI001F148FEC|nr:diguanylate cyclase [Natranaerofaba carboxydovora]UMZ74442.1 Phytochrome-like protein cph2 [Natranaerofaba carboxydovora]
MKKVMNYPKLFYLFIIVILIFVFTSYLIINNSNYTLASSSNGNDPTAATAAVLDLSSWQPGDSLISIDGEWEFYWNELLEPKDFASLQTTQEKSSENSHQKYINFPRAWNGILIDDHELEGTGYATYRLNLITDNTGTAGESNPLLGLKIPRVLTSYNIWVNDELIASAGTVGSNIQDSRPQYLPQVAFFEQRENNEIIIQVSNFSHRSGGVLESITLGSTEDIISLRNYNIAAEIFIFGSLLSMGLYQIFLFSFRRKELASLYFGLFCILVALRTVLVGEIFLIELFPDLDWELAHKLQTLSYYLGVPLIFMFFKSAFPENISTFFLRICQVMGVLFGLLVLFTSARVFTNYNMIYQVFTVVMIIYLTYALAKIISKQKEGANYIVIGALALFITTFHDAIFLSTWFSDQSNSIARSIITRGNLSSYGQLIFVFSHSLVLGKRFSNALIKEEEISNYRKELNENLEKQVKERTEELEEANKTLKQLSTIDPLTGISNRRHFDEVLNLEWRRVLRDKNPISLIFVDLDCFKYYNDYYGHSAGDTCLKMVAKVLKDSLNRASDLVARYGGEEFVVVLPNMAEDEALQVAEHLRKDIEKLKIEHISSPVYKYVTASFGVSTMIPDENLSPEDLINTADKALYMAKDEGRNRVRYVAIT